MQTARAGDTVRVHYTGTLEDGSIFDSSGSREPLEFTLGAGQVIQGFDDAVTGMSPGDEKRVTIESAAAYGAHRDDLVIALERSQLPDGMEPELGQQLQLSQDGGQTFVVTITDLTEAEIVLDANHPLAGRDLTFDLHLVGIA